MKVSGFTERQALSKEMMDDPRVGDTWSSRFAPVLVVLGVEGDMLRICDKREVVSNRYFTFDLCQQVLITKEELKARLCYSSDQETPWAEGCRHSDPQSAIGGLLNEAESLDQSLIATIRYVPKSKPVPYSGVTESEKLGIKIEEYLKANRYLGHTETWRSLLEQARVALRGRQVVNGLLFGSDSAADLKPSTDLERGAYHFYANALIILGLFRSPVETKEQVVIREHLEALLLQTYTCTLKALVDDAKKGN